MNTTYEEIKAIAPDGVFLSNGPGDPAAMTEVVELVRNVLSDEIPFLWNLFWTSNTRKSIGF